MNKALKIVLIVVGVLILLVLVIPFLIPVNQFRPTIEEKASAALGRKVELGNLSLSLISGSVSADNLSIGDDPKFSSSPFLTAKSLKVGVEVMPLIFSKTLNVTGVTIDTPQVTLLHNGAGRWNYSSLGGAAAKSSSSSSSPADLSIKKFELKDGSIIVGATNSQKRNNYDHVDVTASDVSITVDFNTKYNLRKNTGVLLPSTLKIGSAAAHLGGTYESAGEATKVNIKLEGKDMPAKDLEAFLPALGINLPRGASLQGGTLNTDLNITGPTNRLVTNGTVGVYSTKLVGFDLGSKLSAISMLTGVKTGNDLNIEKLTANLHIDPDGLKADNFSAVLP